MYVNNSTSSRLLAYGDAKVATTTAKTTSSSTVSISNAARLALQSASTDKTAPRITRFTPSDGGKNVKLNANIKVTFSEDIVAGSGNITLKDSAGNVVETFSASSGQVSINKKTLTINPANNLANGTKYYVSFEAGSVTDKAGNAFKGSSSYDFTTVKERTPPKAQNYLPSLGDGATATKQNLYVGFDEAIKKGKGFVVITDESGKVFERVSITSSQVKINGNTLSVDPKKDFSENTRYKIKIDSGAVTDLAGNKFKGLKNYGFTTTTKDASPSSPTWSTSSPVSGGSSSTVGTYSVASTKAASAFNINITYTGDISYLTYFQQARDIWESVITGDLQDVNGIDDLNITASVGYIDGVNGTLGFASPSTLRSGGPNANTPLTGSMQFDSSDLSNMISNGTFMRVVLHEMGHVLGIGSLWSTFGLNSVAGQYSGTYALNAYKAMSGGAPSATYVPLETGGGGGTANVHWAENVFGDELMTGYAESDPHMPLSILTVAALQDLGYTVDTNMAEAYTVSTALQSGIPAVNSTTIIDTTV